MYIHIYIYIYIYIYVFQTGFRGLFPQTTSTPGICDVPPQPPSGQRHVHGVVSKQINTNFGFGRIKRPF